MRKNLLLLITAVLLSMASAFAQGGTTGPLTWELTGIEPNLTLTISGEGEMPDYEYDGSPWYDYIGSITTVVIDNGVTTIGRSAFNRCYALTSVNIPKSVTAIGDDAFYCCEALTLVNIPSSVTTIGRYAFFYCIGLTSIEVDSENANYFSIDGILFNKEKTILICYPAGKTNSSYTVPNSVMYIELYAISFCKALNSVSIPNSVMDINYSCFSGCTALNSINVDNENTNYSSTDGILFDKEKTILLRYPAGKMNSSYTIPNSVITIRCQAFEACALSLITIPNSVSTIEVYAFSACNALTSVINLNPEPIDISFAVFNGVNISACTLKVLENSIDAYRDAPVWQDFNIEGIVGIENYTTPVLVAYPNPTTGVLRITSAESQVTDIEIFDVYGRKLPMSSVSFKSLETLIDISHLTAGLYFLKINTEAGEVIKKVLKE